jgi:putative DNA primase/helicase
VLIHCHHAPSCPPADIMAALWMTTADLFSREAGRDPPSGNGKANRGPKPERHADPTPEAALRGMVLRCGKPTGCWTYHNVDGSEAFRVYRFDFSDSQTGEPGKDFRPVHRTAEGWVVRDPPGALPLYHLPELADAARVYVTEGEKSADEARRLGVVASTSAHGAGSPAKTDWTPLAGKEVIILPDHDAPGEAYAEAVAKILSGLGPPARVKVVRLADLWRTDAPIPEGGDLVEWLRDGVPETWAVEECRALLERLVDDAPTWEPPASGAAPPGSPAFDGPPRPLSIDLLPVPKLDPRMIPDRFRGWLADIAERGCFPLEYPTAAALVAVGGLIGRRLAIRPKRRDHWLVVPNLWGAIVGLPGIQKSPPVEEALRPLRRLVADASDRHGREMADWQARQLVAASKRAAAKDALKDKAKKRASEEELAKLAQEATLVTEEAQPRERRHLVNDATIEKLGELMAENPHGLIWFRDELIGLLRTLDRQGHEADRAFLLESWSGLNGYTFDRIGRGKVYIPANCLAIFGTIQPGPLSRYLRGSISGEEADGFVPRFQVLVYPDPPVEFVNIDRYPETEAKNAAYAVFQALERLDPAGLGCEVDEDTGIPFLRFASDAQDFFDDWRVELENRLRSATLSSVMAIHLSKYRSLLPSLALVFHLIDSCPRPDEPAVWARLDPVSREVAMMAAAWCELLEAHARRIYQAATDGDVDSAVTLDDRLKQSLPNPFTCWQVAQKGWSGLATVEEVRRAVGLLASRDRVRVVEVPPTDRGGRPGEQVWIHPALREEKGGNA